MENKLPTEVTQLLEAAEQFIQQGEREKAYQSSLNATSLAPNEALAWYARSQTAPSSEEQLMCLSRAYGLNPTLSTAKQELRLAVHGLLKQEPFLAYVYETELFYQVRSGRDLLINIPKDRAFETPYLQKAPGSTHPAFHWLTLSLLALFLGGVGAIVFAPITAFQALRMQAAHPSQADRIRLWIVFVLSILIWLASIPISWLFLIRFYPT